MEENLFIYLFIIQASGYLFAGRFLKCIKENIFLATNLFSHHKETVASGTEIKAFILSSSTFFIINREHLPLKTAGFFSLSHD